jgi:hypothetical protein
MASYVKATDFASKDALLTGDPAKIIKGTEIDTEFNAISVAISTKADTVSPTFIGTPAAPTATGATNTTQIATTAFVQAAITATKEALYPVGSIYTNATSSTNPATLLGFGTWSAFGAGRVMVGFNAGDPLFDTAEETGGSKDAIAVAHTHTFSATTNTTGSHQHAAPSAPSENSSPRYPFGSGGGSGTEKQTSGGVYTVERALTNSAGDHSHTISGTTASTGSGGTNANIQPYITVYLWKRTA